MPAPLPPSRKQAPLSPMSSPQQQNNSLPVPPPFSRRTSNRSARLHLPQRQEEPPIPPRLVGSPLLNTLLSATKQPLTPRHDAWVDGNEFGTHRGQALAAPLPPAAQPYRRCVASLRDPRSLDHEPRAHASVVLSTALAASPPDTN